MLYTIQTLCFFRFFGYPNNLSIDFSEDTLDDIKDEWRTIIRAYSNWFLTKKKWGGLKNTTHPKENIVDWCIKMGINEKNGEFENWIEKEG